MLTTDLALWPDIEIVSRQLLGEILREQWIQQRATSESKVVVRLGQLSGARYLVKGTVYPLDSGMSVEVHVLDVESGIVVRTVRVRGSLEDIPVLARGLAQHIGNLFGPQTSPTIERTPELSKRTQSREDGRGPDVDVVQEMVLPDHFSGESQSQVLASDVLLRLERRQRLRGEAWLLAEEVWRRGLSVVLRAPEFSNSKHASGQESTEEYLWIPVSSFFLPDRLEGIHPSLHVSFSTVDSQNKGTLTWESDEEITNQLFSERFQVPRRLFVRGISQTGEVVGVSSQGSWRVDRLIESADDGSIHLLVWPNHILEGKAGFLENTLAQEPAIQHFDAKVVPVPDEQRIISVENLVQADSSRADITTREKILQKWLKKWFQENWVPPVMESLPVSGYLPGNRRVLQLRISGKDGMVQDIRLLQGPDEPFLVAQTKQLFPKLLGICLHFCGDDASGDGIHEESFEFRVQLDLVKDLQHVGLGEHVN